MIFSSFGYIVLAKKNTVLMFYKKLLIDNNELPIEVYLKSITKEDHQDYIFINQNKLLPSWQESPKTLIFILLKSRIKLNGSDLIKEQLEKDYLLPIFLNLSLKIYQQTQEKNLDIAIICPKTGYPLYTQKGEEFFNIPSLITRHLPNFKTKEIYCDLIHPQWGRKVYPSLILSSNSLELIKPIIDDVLQ